MEKAKPEDLEIVCGEVSVETENQYSSPENELAMEVLEYHNHPSFDPKKIDNGYDISVYKVNDKDLRDLTKNYFNPRNIWPACLPKSDSDYNSWSKKDDFKGRIAGWDSPDVNTRNVGFYKSVSFDEFESETFFLKEALMEKIPCTDHQFMETNTTYPSKGACFRIHTVSLVHSAFTGNENKNIKTFEGGCQVQFFGELKSVQIPPLYIRQSINPSFITDARCFMQWIASKYDMKMPDDYDKNLPNTCKELTGSGMKTSSTESTCKAFTLFGQLEKCNLTISKEYFDIPECYHYDHEGHSDHSFYCITESGRKGTCRNDCPGVKEVQVGIGAVAGLTALSLAGSAIVPPLTVASSALLGYFSLSRESQCPEVCKLSFGMCLRGRRCRVLQNSSQSSRNTNRRRITTQYYQKSPEQVLADMRGRSDIEQLRIIQELMDSSSLPDNYVERRDGVQQTGLFHESLGFMSKLFDTVYNYIFQ